MSNVRLSGLSRSFGPVHAVDDISIQIASGELLALLGPSGCGKTTLLRLIAGLEPADHGAVTIGGRDVTRLQTRLRSIGMVFQSYALFPNMTLRQNIAFPLRARRWERGPLVARTAELLSLVRLTDQADRYPRQVSGGQQQRAALARALAAKPEVLLLDEPLSALDAVVRTHLRDEIRRIQQLVGTTTVYVTHDQSEALAIADRVVVMQHGRIEQLASPEELYERPSTAFAASFVGSRNALALPVHAGRVSLGQAFAAPAPAAANGMAMAFFRPEDVEVSRNGAGQPAGVEMKVFLGALTRLHLVTEIDGVPLRFSADVPSRSASGLGVGDRVGVIVASAGVSVFPQ